MSPPAAGGTLRYVGDLAREDARLLASLAQSARRIVELGSGASTQIFAQCAPQDCEILCLEPDTAWIRRTRALLDVLAPGRAVRFVEGGTVVALGPLAAASVDLVFDDGPADLRLDFALAVWPLIPAGGRLVLHDVRRPRDAGNVLAVAWRYFREVASIRFNDEDSNCAVIEKGPLRAHVDWNRVEGRAAWQVGDDDLETTLRRVAEGMDGRL